MHLTKRQALRMMRDAEDFTELTRVSLTSDAYELSHILVEGDACYLVVRYQQDLADNVEGLTCSWEPELISGAMRFDSCKEAQMFLFGLIQEDLIESQEEAYS